MQVERFVLSFPQGNSECSFSGDTKCQIKGVSLGRLFRQHQADSPELPYLIAKVGNAVENSQFFDGRALYEHQDLVKPVSACYFAFAYSDEGIHHFHFAEKQSLVCFDPKEILARINYVRDCLQAKKIEQAKKWMEACLCLSHTKDSEVAIALAEVGNFLRIEREEIEPDFIMAKRFLEKSLMINPGSVVVLSALGAIYGLGGNGIAQDCAMAKWFFEQAVAFDPYNSHALASLGELYAIGGNELKVDHAKAVYYFKRASKMDPYDAHVLARLGDCMAQTDDGCLEEIKSLFQRSLDLDSSNAFTFAAYGDFLRLQGDSRAKWYLERAFELNPRDSFTLDCLGYFYEQMHNSEKAKFYFEEARKYNQECSEVTVALSSLELD